MFRILLAGIVGAIVVFMWSFVAHSLLPLGEMGIKQLPNEAATMSTLRSAVSEPGMYRFPSINQALPKDQQEDDVVKRYQAGPRGVLVINPQTLDRPMIAPSMLVKELGSIFVCSLIASCIVAGLAVGRFTRVLVVTAMGIFAVTEITLSYWIWDGFPDAFLASEFIIETAAWFLAGLFIAFIVPKRATFKVVI